MEILHRINVYNVYLYFSIYIYIHVLNLFIYIYTHIHYIHFLQYVFVHVYIYTDMCTCVLDSLVPKKDEPENRIIVPPPKKAVKSMQVSLPM